MPEQSNIYVLVSKYLANQLSEEEVDIVQQWRAQNPEMFEQLIHIWEEAKSETDSYRTQQNKERLNQRIDALEAEQRQPPLRKSYFWLKAAAAISLIILFGGLIFYYGNHLLAPAEQMVWIEKEAKMSQIVSLKLEDGTKVKLNAGSKLRYAKVFDEGSIREVFLEGQAFFDVAHNPERPFIVRAGNLSTRVLGTSFAVSAYPDDDDFKVAVVSGKVEVALPEVIPTALLLPNKQIVCNKNTHSWYEENIDAGEVMAWLDGGLRFEHTTLGEVAKVLQRYYNITIKFEKEAIKNCYLTAEFEKEKLVNVMEAIQFINDIEYRFDEEILIISGDGCSP